MKCNYCWLYNPTIFSKVNALTQHSDSILKSKLFVCLCPPFSPQIGEFYCKDPFGMELGLEFWCPTEPLQHNSLQGSYLGMALQRPPHKQVIFFQIPFITISFNILLLRQVMFFSICLSFQSVWFSFHALMQVVLSKFVRQMGDLLPSTLYISYLRMLKGLANGPQSAHYCFSLLKTNGASHGKRNEMIAVNSSRF